MKPQRARILAMQAVFQLDFHSRGLDDILRFDWIDYEIPPDEATYAGKLIKGVIEHTDEINIIIEKFSENWTMERISSVNRAILRISIFQMKFMQEEVPVKVVIDEAIRMSKKYGDLESSRFINGLLDAFRKDGLS